MRPPAETPGEPGERLASSRRDRSPRRGEGPAERLASRAWTAGCLAAVVALGWVDHRTGPDLGFSLFYLAPVAWAAWRTGRASGLIVAAAASASWLLVDLTSSPPERAAISAWNGFSRLCTFAAVALLLSALRRDRSRLQRLNQQLSEQNRDLDAFAGRVAHDLKNTLGPVVMAPSLLRRSATEPRRVLELADRTERASRKAMAVLAALLAFARATRSTDDEVGEVRPVLDDVLEELDPLVGRLGVTVEVGDVAAVAVRCDPDLLHVVLANVVGNAVKYLEGRPVRRVRIAARAAGGAWRLDVEDTGPGIPLRDRERIFEPFVRIGGTQAPGTGIGLATVQRIVHARGGGIAVDSEEGTGSRFQVWLPLARPPGARPPGPRPPAGLPAERPAAPH